MKINSGNIFAIRKTTTTKTDPTIPRINAHTRTDISCLIAKIQIFISKNKDEHHNNNTLSFIRLILTILIGFHIKYL